MKDFNKLIDRSYIVLQKRGCINDNTTGLNFIQKIEEEFNELIIAFYNESEERRNEELTDLMTVCVMYLKWLGLDPIEEFEKVVIKNENR